MTELKLHKIEKKILLSLVKHDKTDIEKLAYITNLSLDNIRRGIEWLKYKGMVSVTIHKDSIVQLISERSDDGRPSDNPHVSDNLTLPDISEKTNPVTLTNAIREIVKEEKTIEKTEQQLQPFEGTLDVNIRLEGLEQINASIEKKLEIDRKKRLQGVLIGNDS